MALLSSSKNSEAAFFLDRSLLISSGQAGDTGVVYTFSLTFQSSLDVGSLEFEICSNDPFPGKPCTVPAGFDASSVTLTDQSGETGFSIHANSTANRLVLSRTPTATTAVASVYEFSGITNPTGENSSYYVRLGSFAADDGTGSRIDQGGIAFSISEGVSIATIVPPYLTFCAGITVSANCSSTLGNFVNFGTFSPNSTAFASIQLAAATNAEFGYSISLLGTTLTAGNNIIEPMNLSSTSLAGTSQFGLNLRNNATPDVGADISGSGSGTVVGDYAVADQYKFAAGDAIAQAPNATDFNTYTVSYVVNVPIGQAPGRYASTISFIALATF